MYFRHYLQEGVFLLGTSTTMDFEYNYGLLSDASLMHSSLNKGDLFDIEQIWAGIIGISFKNNKSHDLIQNGTA